MDYRASATDILTSVADLLVKKQKYPNREEALRELALAAVRSKTAYYRRRIRKLERKYETDFDTFTARLKDRATPTEEDDWLEWRSARRMLADWQRAYQDLRNDSTR
jgi:hypothetical protein